MNVYTSYVLSLSTYIHIYIYIILIIFYIFAVYVNAYIGIHTYACVFVICVCVVIFCYTTVSPASSIVIRLVSAVPGIGPCAIVCWAGRPVRISSFTMRSLGLRD